MQAKKTTDRKYQGEQRPHPVERRQTPAETNSINRSQTIQDKNRTQVPEQVQNTQYRNAVTGNDRNTSEIRENYQYKSHNYLENTVTDQLTETISQVCKQAIEDSFQRLYINLAHFVKDIFTLKLHNESDRQRDLLIVNTTRKHFGAVSAEHLLEELNTPIIQELDNQNNNNNDRTREKTSEQNEKRNDGAVEDLEEEISQGVCSSDAEVSASEDENATIGAAVAKKMSVTARDSETKEGPTSKNKRGRANRTRNQANKKKKQ
jgi:hypothetical protein